MNGFLKNGFYAVYHHAPHLPPESSDIPDGTVIIRPKHKIVEGGRNKVAKTVDLGSSDPEDLIKTNEIPKLGKNPGETPDNPIKLDFDPGADYSAVRVKIIEYCRQHYPDDGIGEWRQSRTNKGIEVQKMMRPKGERYSLYFDISSVFIPKTSPDRNQV